MASTGSSALAVVATLALLLSPAAAAVAACPPQQVDGIVSSAVNTALQGEIALAAGLLRIFFHDCFPNGCDASLLLNATSNRETAHGANQSIQPRAMLLIESIRAKVHAACGGPTVSCADITLLATRAAVVFSGGPPFPVPLNNLDSTAPATKDLVDSLPGPGSASVGALVERFATRGLRDVRDLVALSGAHTIGRAQCRNFGDRSGRGDDTFSKKLAANCTKRPNTLQNLDVITPDSFDNAYFTALTNNQGVFTSDMALIKNKTTEPIVREFAKDKNAFFVQFAKSMAKLANAPKQPARGDKGEIRRFSCLRTNAQGIQTAVDAAVEEEGFAASF